MDGKKPAELHPSSRNKTFLRYVDAAMASAEGDVDNEAGPSTDSERGPREPVRPKKRRPVQEEDEPAVLSGRLLGLFFGGVAVVVIVMSTLGDYLEPDEPTATPVASFAVGKNAVVRITLVTADYNLLGCASEQSFEGVHCAHKSPTEPWPRSPSESPEDYNNKLNIVMPYRTWYDNKLVFVSGLWNQPEVAFRMHREPSQGIPSDKLARFAVECNLHFVGRFDQVKLRWSPQQSWNDPDGPAWVGRAESCKLIDEPQ